MKNLIKIDPRIFLVVVLSFLLGWQFGHKDVQIRWANYKPTVSVKDRDVPKEVSVDFKLFWDTWDLLSRSYIDKKALDPSKLFYGSIAGMVAAVGDPYTVFLPPEQQKSTKEELGGSFDGVGIQLGYNDAKPPRLVVVAPLEGTPAKKAGVKPQDLIVKIDDKDTTGMSLPEAVRLIRGIKGTKVNLTFFREGDSDTHLVALVRDTIVVKSVELSFSQTPKGKSVAVIKLSRFGEKTKDEWTQAVSQILTKNPGAAILDLRNNPGGYLEGAVFIASEFLDGGDVVLQENNEGQKVNFKVNRIGSLTKLPLEVLINKGSASASEIVAGALQDRKRAHLVGEKSFGKGTIQEAQDLAGGTGIHITVAKWLTPNNRWVNDTQGFEPDVKIESVKPSPVPSGIGASPVPDGTGQNLRSEDLKEDQTKDAQMEKALELLD